MYGMTMDLFADESGAAAAPVVPVAPAAPATPATPAAPARSRPGPRYHQLLELALACAGRKLVLKAMEPEVREGLVAALEAVANAKQDAYDRALAGDRPGSPTWPPRQPALELAIGKLHSAFIDIDLIPMAGHAGV